MKGVVMPIFLLRKVSHRFWSTGSSILTHQLLLRVTLSVKKKKSKEVDALIISVFNVWAPGKNKGKKLLLGVRYYLLFYIMAKKS